MSTPGATWLLLFFAALLAADPYSHHIWRTEDGLPQNTIQAISQTPDGYLWIGTPEGLARFDGVRFVVFNRSNTPEFQDDSILTLQPGSDGSLWIGSEGGGLVLLKERKFQALGALQGLTNGFVRSILVDHAGTLWVGTDRGLFRQTEGRFTRLDGTPAVPLASVVGMAEDSAQRLWIATQNEILTIQQERLVKVACSGGNGMAQIHSIYRSPEGAVWLQTIAGLKRLQDGCVAGETLLPLDDVNVMLQDRSGDLWGGTAGRGLIRYRSKSAVTFHVPDNTVSAIFEDQEQNLWIGSRDGLMRLSKTAVATLGVDENVSTIFEDHAGALWIATVNGQIFKSNGKEMKRAYAEMPVHFRTMFEDRAGALWLGTGDAGAIRIFNGAETRLGAREGLRSTSIREILEDPQGHIWLATGSGISRWDGHQIKTYYLEDGLTYPSIRCLAIDQNGDVLAGTDGGLNRIHNSRIIPDPAFAPLLKEKIWALHLDGAGTLWIGTRGGGLMRLKSGKLFRFESQNGLPNESVFRILEGGGKLWMSTPSGVLSAELAELNGVADGKPGPISAAPYGTPDGMESSHMSGGIQPAGYRTRAGELWFPTMRGAVHINPGQLRINRPMPVLIERIVARGSVIPPASTIVIPPGRGDLEIDFTACYLLAPQRVTFKYKMDALDQDWRFASKARAAYYTNVPPGRYVLNVTASDAGSPGPPSEATMSVVWQPAFYQATWFYVLCICTAALLAYLALQFYTRQAKARYTVLLNERLRLAREMHDTLIQGCVGVSTLLEAASRFQKSNSEEAGQLLDQAKLQVKATLDEARQAVWNLRHATEGDHAIATLSDLARRLGNENGIRIETEVLGLSQTLEPSLDRTLLLVAREALRNAVAHAGAHQIQMRFVFRPSEVCMEVTDDGRGFESGSALQAANGHFGILGMRERVEQLGGKFLLRSSVGRGTTVSASLPLQAPASHPS